MPDLGSVLERRLAGVDGWLSHDEALALTTLASLGLTGQVLEIGAWKGRSAIALATGIEARGGGTVWSVDHHTGSPEHRTALGEVWTLPEFVSNIVRAGVQSFVSPLVIESTLAAHLFEGTSLDLVFVDGSRDEESVWQDLHTWIPRLGADGVLVVDDAEYPPIARVLRGAFPWPTPERVGKMAIYRHPGADFRDLGGDARA